MLMRLQCSGAPRVNFTILVLCYLEVVLWTACLLSSSAAAAESVAGHGYLQRETGNLKYLTCQDSLPAPLFDELQVPADLQLELEHWCQQQQFEKNLSQQTCSLHPAVGLDQLRALLLEEKGLPAPFTGIAAID